MKMFQCGDWPEVRQEESHNTPPDPTGQTAAEGQDRREHGLLDACRRLQDNGQEDIQRARLPHAELGEEGHRFG